MDQKGLTGAFYFIFMWKRTARKLSDLMIYLYEEDGTTFKVVKNEQQRMQPRPQGPSP